MKKNLLSIFVISLLLCVLTACGDIVIDSPAEAIDPSSAREIKLNGSSIDSPSGSVKVSGNTATISSPGSYSLSGTLDDGQIIVDAVDDSADVIIILNNADITCLTGPAINILQAKNVDIVLADGSSNRLTSGTQADVALCDDTKSGGAITAHDDLDIEGSGSLDIFGYINNGITCKDDVDINGGTITVYAANNGIRGSESVVVNAGTLTVDAANDGIKSTTADQEGKGYVSITGGTVNIVCRNGDGISAETTLSVEGGEITVEAQGDPAIYSSKAIKAKTGLTVTGGVISATSADHAVHCTADMNFSGGTVTAVSSSGKAVSAHGEISISGGDFALTSADDGLESASYVRISGGNLNICAGNDGIKAGEKSTGFAAAAGTFELSGGAVTITAASDPIDAKALSFVNGGTIFASGNSSRIKSFSADSSTQPFIACFLSGTPGASLTVADGGSVLSSLEYPLYGCNVVLFSSPDLVSGQSYTVSDGITSTSASA